MKLAILTIGIPGSGKTTCTAPLVSEFGLVRINRDDIRREWFGIPHPQEPREAVRREADHRTAEALASGKSVVLDSIFVSPDDRKRTIAVAREAGAERVIGLVFTTPLEVAKARNKQRKHVVPDEAMGKLHEKLGSNPPALDEGFDALYTSDQLKELEEEELKG